MKARIATPRQEAIVWGGVRELALWYCAGYWHGARGVPSRYSEVPQRHPEDSMMYADGYEDGKNGRPHKVGREWETTAGPDPTTSVRGPKRPAVPR